MVGLLIVTHADVGAVLLRTAFAIIGQRADHVRLLGVPFDADPERCRQLGRRYCVEIDDGDGIVCLTDVPGSTPARLAIELAQERGDVSIITGINLPMLLRLLNYADETRESLCVLAVEGGCRAIFLVNVPGEGAENDAECEG